jgi:hypothetical protein
MVEALPKGGGTSTCDALTMALLVSPNAGRRHVIIDFTQAVDYLSVVDIGSVGRIAGRTDTLIHFVLAPTWTGGYGHGRPALPPTAETITIADTTGGTTQVLRSTLSMS